jgi:ParB family chromosome partitioning protein
MKEKVQNIPIDQIRILNPRHRDRRKFEFLVHSIKNVGLKKPIKVSTRVAADGEEPGYDLVCGQGRIEAFLALGYQEIPAVVVQVSKEDRLLMSLIENMARRFPMPMDLIQEIERLKKQGDSNVAIGKKLDIADSHVGGLLALKNSGEERLLDAALKGKIPLGVAIEIAKAEGAEAQRELLKAYEDKQLNQASIRAVRRIVEQRRFLGKARKNDPNRKRDRTTAEGLVNTYKRQVHRQKVLVRKAKICEARLIFVVNAVKRLIADENFINLLRAEQLATMPDYLAASLKQ